MKNDMPSPPDEDPPAQSATEFDDQALRKLLGETDEHFTKRALAEFRNTCREGLQPGNPVGDRPMRFELAIA